MANQINRLHVAGILDVGLFLIGAWNANLVILSFSLYFAVHLFYWDMDTHSPWSSVRLVVRCCLGGAAFIGSGATLLTVIVLHHLNWQPGIDDHGWIPILIFFVYSSLLIILAKNSLAIRSTLLLVLAVAGGALALLFDLTGSSGLPCVYAALVTIVVVLNGWRLARHLVPIAAYNDVRI